MSMVCATLGFLNVCFRDLYVKIKVRNQKCLIEEVTEGLTREKERVREAKMRARLNV